jgi:tRNA nucleotidyltransferase (CCA-adding enzyme)
VTGTADDHATLDAARAVARAVDAAGGRALLVGGWVRDRLLGRAAKDIDLEVYGLDAVRLKALLTDFGSVNTVGESFTVYKVAGLDVSLPRRESKAGRGHRGFVVAGDPTMSPEDAARRRDFTVNAIAWDPLGPDEELVDPFNGRRDLEARVLRMVDAATFADDSLRVLRAVQFAARFDMTLDAESRSCFPSCTLWSAASRSPNGIRRVTCGSTPCRWSTRHAPGSTISIARGASR